MKFRTAAILFILLGVSPAFSKDGPIKKTGAKLKAEAFEVNLFTNQYYFPFKGIGNIAYAKYHPGISVGYLRDLKQNAHSTWYSDARVGLYYHRFIQTGVQVYGNIGYRRKLPASFFIAGEYGLGYLHSIKNHKTFKADADGNYSKVRNFGRPQLMTGLGIKLGRQVEVAKNKGRVYINYQPWFQLPFINAYVPLLPNNSFHIGFDLILK